MGGRPPKAVKSQAQPSVVQRNRGCPRVLGNSIPRCLHSLNQCYDAPGPEPGGGTAGNQPGPALVDLPLGLGTSCGLGCISELAAWFVERGKLSLRFLNNPQGRKASALSSREPLSGPPMTQHVVPGYLLMLTSTAVFFISRKKSLLQRPLVAGVKEQVTTMKSASAASWAVGTGEGTAPSEASPKYGERERHGRRPGPPRQPPVMETPKMLPGGLAATCTTPNCTVNSHSWDPGVSHYSSSSLV